MEKELIYQHNSEQLIATLTEQTAAFCFFTGRIILPDFFWNRIASFPILAAASIIIIPHIY